MRITIDTDGSDALVSAPVTIRPQTRTEPSPLDGGAAAPRGLHPEVGDAATGNEPAALAAVLDGGAVPDWLLQAIDGSSAA